MLLGDRLQVSHRLPKWTYQPVTYAKEHQRETQCQTYNIQQTRTSNTIRSKKKKKGRNTHQEQTRKGGFSKLELI